MRADRKEGEPWSREQLLVDMQSCGISEALVTHAMSRDYDPAAGNKELCRLLSGTPNLHGCWAVLPPATREVGEPETFIREMHAHDVSTVIAYSHAHNYSLSDWSLRPLLSALENVRIPILLPFGQFTWDEVERLCSEYVQLPIIVIGLNYRQLRHLLPLWEKHTNLFVDLSWFSIHDGLSYLSERGFLKQVVFGTNYPLYEPGAAVTMVTYSGLTDADKQRLAGGTLREILAGIRRERL
jgi:predicted TIM-barrel fold metal-dependent hydrolase